MSSDEEDTEQVALQHLATRSVHSIYGTLSSLLHHQLPSADSTQRRQKLLDFTTESLQLVARLLGATRWADAYAKQVQHAGDVEQRCLERIESLNDAADDLWTARARAAHMALPTNSVATAVDALSCGKVAMPRVLRLAAGLPVDDLPDEGCAQRVANATRRAIRDALAATPRLVVECWTAEPACVRIGVPRLWSADVLLDSLHSRTSLLRALTIRVLVAPDPDAPGHSTVTNHLEPQHEAMLCGLADDRMAHAVAAAERMAPNIDRVKVMLGALYDLLCSEVCAPLVMRHIRAQAAALTQGPWATACQVTGAESLDTSSDSDLPPTAPVTINYWLSDRNAASITVSQFSPKSTTVGESRTQLVVVTHEPPLPAGAARLAAVGIESDPSQINIERLLAACVKSRAADRLLAITEAVLRRRKELGVHPRCLTIRTSCVDNQARIMTLGTNLSISKVGDEALVVHLHQDRCLGVEVRVAARTGALRVRPFGAAGLVTPSARAPTDGDTWAGEKHFESNAEEERIVCAIVKNVLSRVKLDFAARAVCALDVGVSNTLPPGTASVAATAPAERSASQLVPPFAPLERRSPRRFLTLSPPPVVKEYVNGVANSFVTAVPPESRAWFGREAQTTKRPRLTYATTSDALVFIQESSSGGEEQCPLDRKEKQRKRRRCREPQRPGVYDMEDVDRYNGTAAAAAAWAVTRDVVERRLRRDSLLRAFVAANVASAAHTHHMKSGDDGALHLESASRVLLKVKCEPLPVRRAELLLRGSDAWQVRLSLLPPIFDSTDAALVADPMPNGGPGRHAFVNRESGAEGNLWTVGVACGGSQLTFTYPSANAASVRSFFRDLTRARTAAALARGVPPSPFYRVLRRSPVRIVVGVGPFNADNNGMQQTHAQPNGTHAPTAPTHSYTATVEYVYSRGNSGGFSLTFSPTKPTMEMLAPLIEEALDASGGQVGGILAGLLERACPVAAAAESAVRERGNGRIRFVTALRVRAVFAGVEQGATRSDGNDDPDIRQNQPPPGQVAHAVDVDARGGGGVVTVIDVGRATAVMIQQGFANRGGSAAAASDGRAGGGGAAQQGGRRSDFVSVPRWDDIVADFCASGHAEAQRAGSTVVLNMCQLERFLTALVASVRPGGAGGGGGGMPANAAGAQQNAGAAANAQLNVQNMGNVAGANAANAGGGAGGVANATAAAAAV